MIETSKKKKMSPLSVVLILSGVFFMVFLVISGAMFMMKPPGGGEGSSSFFGTGAVGVVELNGVIMDSKKTLSRLKSLEENGEIKAVVLRLNSPGGAVAPSQEIYEAVRKFKKPLVASMGSIAASGAFYVACGAKKVFANPGTITGSIGVIMEFANLEKLYEWAKIKRYVIKTGKFKDAGAEFREMSAEERELLQGMVDDVLVQFKQAVVTGRKLPLSEVTKVADGRIMSGNQAKAAKLVDELGTIDDAVEHAAQMAGIKGKPRIYYPEKGRRKWLEFLLDENSKDEAEGRASGGVLETLVGWITRLGDGSQGASALTPGIYWLWNGAR